MGNIDTVGGLSLPSEWGGQNEICPSNMGYCYGPQFPVTLNVAISDLTSVTNFPEYLNAVYVFLLAAASLVAVVLVMIGGLQYATARGDAGKITKAKERIGKAVIGLVLLLSAYVIANLIDPSTTSLSVLRLPKVKKVIVIDKNSTCEVLDSYGFGIGVNTASGNGKPECGTKGYVAVIPDEIEGKEGVVSSTLKVGDVCSFSACSDPAMMCTTTGCQACFMAPDPSPSLCSTLVPDRTNDYPKGTKYYCEYHEAFSSGLVDFCGSVDMSFNKATGVNCEVLRSGSPQNCSAYNSLYLNAGASSIYGSSTVISQYAPAQDIFGTICAEDPCGLFGLSEGLVVDGNCIYHPSEDGKTGTCANE